MCFNSTKKKDFNPSSFKEISIKYTCKPLSSDIKIFRFIQLDFVSRIIF